MREWSFPLVLAGTRRRQVFHASASQNLHQQMNRTHQSHRETRWDTNPFTLQHRLKDEKEQHLSTANAGVDSASALATTTCMEQDQIGL